MNGRNNPVPYFDYWFCSDLWPHRMKRMVIGMNKYKCKKSVFCVLFLFFFGMGTICGSALFSLLLRSQFGWIGSYCSELMLQRTASPVSTFLFFCCPLAAVWALGWSTFGRKLIFPAAALRGCVTAYVFSACFTAGFSIMSVLLRELFLLPVFYALSLHGWVRQEAVCAGFVGFKHKTLYVRT